MTCRGNLSAAEEMSRDGMVTVKLACKVCSAHSVYNGQLELSGEPTRLVLSTWTPSRAESCDPPSDCETVTLPWTEVLPSRYYRDIISSDLRGSRRQEAPRIAVMSRSNTQAEWHDHCLIDLPLISKHSPFALSPVPHHQRRTRRHATYLISYSIDVMQT